MRAVLDYINLADQITRMEDVVVFVKSLTPGITRVGRDVKERAEELTSQVSAFFSILKISRLFSKLLISS